MIFFIAKANFQVNRYFIVHLECPKRCHYGFFKEFIVIILIIFVIIIIIIYQPQFQMIVISAFYLKLIFIIFM